MSLYSWVYYGRILEEADLSRIEEGLLACRKLLFICHGLAEDLQKCHSHMSQRLHFAFA